MTIISALILPAVLAFGQENTGELLRRLDGELSNAKTYEGYFQQRVDVLRNLLKGRNTPEQTYSINQQLAVEFSSYSMDSTLLYLNRNRALAVALGDDRRVAETDLMRAREYAMAGYHSDAMDIFDRYQQAGVPEGLEYRYYEVGNYLYGEIAAYSSNNEDYWIRRSAFRAGLMGYLDEGTYEWFDQLRVAADRDGNMTQAADYARKALDVTVPDSRDYARAAYFVSLYEKDEDARIAWLVKSALADVHCATKDYASLNELAGILYRRGDVGRAFRYVADHGMPDALFFNGRLRPWQIAQFFPSLEQAYAARSARAQRRMWALIGIAFLLSLALAGLLVYQFRRQRILVGTRTELEESKARVERRNRELENLNDRLQSLNGELQESNKVRQEYIALFLQNLSENISTTRQYKNHVLKYIRRGNDKYLIEEIEGLPPIEEDIQEFNKMFDRTFVNLYPNFVEEFNDLLAEGEAITPKGEDILTPELRVFALIKLGITESSKIASLLHYSANTVYNYRAKIKNKARGDRELFEDQVRAIE